MCIPSGIIVLGKYSVIQDEWFHNDVELTYAESCEVIGCKFDGNVQINAPITPFKREHERIFFKNYIGKNLEIWGLIESKLNDVKGTTIEHVIESNVKLKTEKL